MMIWWMRRVAGIVVIIVLLWLGLSYSGFYTFQLLFHAQYYLTNSYGNVFCLYSGSDLDLVREAIIKNGPLRQIPRLYVRTL